MSEMDAAAQEILSQATAPGPQEKKVIVGPVVFNEPVAVNGDLTTRSE